MLASSLLLQGLGEVYEADYLHKVAGVAPEDERQKLREQLRGQLQSLFAKLDALSHFHYAPKPVHHDMAVKPAVPALAVEEVAPKVRPCLLSGLL